jgi:hypothetical protein
MRRLRVLSDHPDLGRPNDLRDGFEGAQAYVDAGLAEWVIDRSEPVETGMAHPAAEAAVRRPGRRSARTSRDS